MTDVDKPLLSTKEIVMAGNRIVHEMDNDYTQNLKTGKGVKIDNVGGEYTITLRVPKVEDKPKELVKPTFAGLVKRWA